MLGIRGDEGWDLIPEARSAGGTALDLAGGSGVLIGAPLINAILVRPTGFYITFLIAGTVSTAVLEQAAESLAAEPSTLP